MQQKLKTMYIGAAIVLGLFAVLNVAGFIFHTHGGPPDQWAAHTFAGKIATVSTSSVAVVDARGMSRTFLISDETRIVEGKNKLTVNALEVGVVVMVDGGPKEELSAVAREIRILSTTGQPPKNQH